jgi:hypothetical protein
MRAAPIVAFAALTAGCYHYAFDMGPAAPPAGAGEVAPDAQPKATVTYSERAGTYLNGFVGTGRIDVSRYCARPVRTELRVTGLDVLLGVITLLMYTPHTLYVTCPA